MVTSSNSAALREQTLLHRATIDTPVGPMLALATADALCALEFADPRKGENRLIRLDTRLARWFAPFQIDDEPSGALDRARRWLAGYFSGDTAEEALPPLDMRGAPFELRVWAALREIPRGTTTSYGAIARRLGSLSAPRAVGMANGANPIAIIVPCHRVVGSNGSLTGYGGGLDRKTWLLDHERRWRADLLF